MLLCLVLEEKGINLDSRHHLRNTFSLVFMWADSFQGEIRYKVLRSLENRGAAIWIRGGLVMPIDSHLRDVSFVVPS